MSVYMSEWVLCGSVFVCICECMQEYVFIIILETRLHRIATYKTIMIISLFNKKERWCVTCVMVWVKPVNVVCLIIYYCVTGRRSRTKHGRKSRLKFLSDDYVPKDGEIVYGSWARSECFKVERGLLTFG